jgi:C4-dicarboxylate-specific signal transduction histidine kinase
VAQHDNPAKPAPDQRSWKSALSGALLAFASVTSALLVTQALNSVFPTPLFFAAIVVSTWFGGAASGLLAVALATIELDYYFVPPVHRFALKAGELPYLIQFAVPALLTCWFVLKRKDAEESLTQARDDLESKVRDRTAELRQANRQLQAEIAERIRAEEIVQKTQADLAHVTRVTTLGELAASIAHEVNQPLMAVVINGDACLQWLAREQPDLQEAREAVGRIIAEGNRAGEVIRRIRGLCKKSPLHKVPVKINELIQDIVALTQRELLRNEISLSTELDAALPPVFGDRVQLQQVILNLVVNAIEAMSGTIGPLRELQIRSERDGDAALVTVRDTGPGLPLAEPERIFGAFFTTKPDGLGMGLSISRTIIETHGGRLCAANTTGGAVFQFRLSIYQGAA